MPALDSSFYHASVEPVDVLLRNGARKFRGFLAENEDGQAAVFKDA